MSLTSSDMIQFQGLRVGETLNAQCPECRKRKFYVTRKPTGFAYICFRASCGVAGFIGCAGHVVEPAKSIAPARQVYRGTLRFLSTDEKNYFRKRFGIDLPDREWDRNILVGERDRFAFPIRDPDGILKGFTLRAPRWAGIPSPLPDSNHGPKSLTYCPDDSKLAWYARHTQVPLIIVEDQVSALRLYSMGFSAVALLGTNMSLRDAGKIAAHKTPTTVLALDPDARLKQHWLILEYSVLFQNRLRGALLGMDAKDYDWEDDLIHDLGLPS